MLPLADAVIFMSTRPHSSSVVVFTPIDGRVTTEYTPWTTPSVTVAKN